MRIAALFPGQGSQYPGMADPWNEHPAGRAVLEQCSEVLGYNVADACRDEERLGDTAVLQPALFACDLAAGRVLEAEGVEFAITAGHSLGEFVSLAFSGATDVGPTLEAVVERGRAMHEAGEANPGTMSALVGISPTDAEEIVQTAGRGDVLTVANENSPRQTVVSGSVPAVERAENLARSRGAKAVRLKVAGAFHSSLMQPAAAPIRKAISALEFREPRFPIVANASGRASTQPSALRDLLGRHVVSPVKWERSMRAIADEGVDLFIEAGPGDVLSKLVKRCVPGSHTLTVGSPQDVKTVIDEIGATR